MQAVVTGRCIRHHAEKRQGGRVSKRENDYMNDVNEKMQGYGIDEYR